MKAGSFESDYNEVVVISPLIRGFTDQFQALTSVAGHDIERQL